MGQTSGNRNVHSDVLVAPAPAVDAGDPLASQTEGSAGLRARGQAPLDLAVDGGQLQLCAQGGLEEGDRLVQID